jgi:hypothetical protein
MRDPTKSRTSEVAEGLLIIERYLGPNDKFSIGAEHDEIYAGYETPDKMSDEDRQKMENLGWFTTDFDSWGYFP